MNTGTIKHHIIALTGYAGSGKDTVADLLVTHCGFRKLAFADILKAEVAEAFGCDMRDLVDPVTKNTRSARFALDKAPLGMMGAVVASRQMSPLDRSLDLFLAAPRSPREVMQWWGTEYRRRQSPDYFTRAVAQRIAFYLKNGERRFVVTDCRFQNEAETIRNLGGQLWQVTRPGVTASTTPEGQHASATSGSEFEPDVALHNAHDIRHLQQLVLGEFWAWEAGLDEVRVEIAP